MNLVPDQIYTFKLTTGEELVARLLTINLDHLLVEHPILTVLSTNGLQMMPALFSADMQHPMRLNSCCCVFVAETRDDVRHAWIEAVTGIRPVSKQIITS